MTKHQIGEMAEEETMILIGITGTKIIIKGMLVIIDTNLLEVEVVGTMIITEMVVG